MRGSKIIAFSWTELARTILEECHPVRSGFRECELFVTLTKAICLLNVNGLKANRRLAEGGHGTVKTASEL